jgi:hypothetical protein
MRTLLFLAALAGVLAACQPVNDGTSGARFFADCDMGAVAAHVTTGHVTVNCIGVSTSGATTSTPTTTTTPTTNLTVPVSAAGGL